MTIEGVEFADSTHFPLSIIAHVDTQLHLRVSYNRDLFDEADVATIVDRLQRVFVQVTADSSVRVGEVSLLSEAELAAIDARNETGHEVRGGSAAGCVRRSGCRDSGRGCVAVRG